MLGKRGFIFVVLFIVLSVFVNAVPLGPEYGCCSWHGYQSGGTLNFTSANCDVLGATSGVTSYGWTSGLIGMGTQTPCAVPPDCPGGSISDSSVDHCLCSAESDYPGEVYKKTDGGSCFLGELDCTDGVDRDLNGLTDCSDPDCFSEDVCNPDLAVNTDYSMNICEGSADPKYGVTYTGHYESTVSPHACCGDDSVEVDNAHFDSNIIGWLESNTRYNNTAVPCFTFESGGYARLEINPHPNPVAVKGTPTCIAYQKRYLKVYKEYSFGGDIKIESGSVSSLGIYMSCYYDDNYNGVMNWGVDHGHYYWAYADKNNNGWQQVFSTFNPLEFANGSPLLYCDINARVISNNDAVVLADNMFIMEKRTNISKCLTWTPNINTCAYTNCFGPILNCESTCSPNDELCEAVCELLFDNCIITNCGGTCTSYNNIYISDIEYGYFNDNARYFCSKDLKSGTADEIDTSIGRADWKWWDATVDPFRIHTITIS